MTERNITRLRGLILVFIGAAILVVLLAGVGTESLTVSLILAGVGPFAVMVGIGVMIAPDPPNVPPLKMQDDMGNWLGRMPLFWRIWFFLTILVGFATAIWVVLTKK